MSLFNLKNGELKEVIEAPRSESLAAWFGTHAGLLDSALPERLLLIGDWNGSTGTSGLLALDRQGALVILMLADRTPLTEWIEEASSTAWQLRYTEYDDLDSMSKDYFKRNGLSGETLAEVHADHFSLRKTYRPARFNQNQRLIVLAPDLSEAAIEKLQWCGIEMQVEAFLLKFIDLDAENRLVSIEPVDALSGGRLSSLISLIAQAPSSIAEKLLPGLKYDAVEPGGNASAPPTLTSKASSFFARVGLSTRAQGYLILSMMVLAYIITFSLLTVRNHNNFGTFGFDLGIFDQGTWLLSQLKTPFVTVRGLHIFGDHLSLILLLLAPLYRIWDDVRLLLVLQTVVLAIGAVPIFLMAKERLKSRLLGIALASSYLLYPSLEWLNRDHFHPEAIATPCLLFAFYFVTKQRYVPFAIFSALAILAKEDISLIVMMLGIYVAIKVNRKAGIATSLLALAWFITGLNVIIPHFNQVGVSYIKNYAHLGSSLGEVIIDSITHPGLILSILLEERKLIYLLQLLAPVSFFPLVSIEALLIALPALFLNLVSEQGYMDTIQFHYTATIIPFIFVASILALEGLDLGQRRRQLLAGLIVVTALICNYFWSPSPLSPNFNQGHWSSENKRQESIESALSLLPKDANVSAPYYMVPHLTHREKIYEFPNPFMAVNWGVRGENPDDDRLVEYVIADLENVSGKERSIIDKLREKDFKRIFNRESIIVLKRKPASR